MKREFLNIPEEEIGDYSTTHGSWSINGEIYEFIETFLGKHCDGECNNVIVKRNSDGKYFQFTWSYYHDRYFYDPDWEEVEPREVVKTKWGWWKK